MKVCGIDVGLSGALAVYDTATGWLDAIDMPTFGEGTQRRVNALVAMRWISANTHRPDRAYIERVSAMPSIPDPDDPHQIRRGMGAASAFRFGDAVGTIRTVVVCLQIPFVQVVPQTWKKTHGLRGSKKEESRQRALALFPSYAHLFSRKMDENRAEASLIAWHGARELLEDQEMAETLRERTLL